MVPTFIGIITITFFLTKLRPDALTTASMGPDGMKESSGLDEFQQKMRTYYGLDQPLHLQYLRLWKNILTLNFSESRIDHRPVLSKIGEALPIMRGTGPLHVDDRLGLRPRVNDQVRRAS